MRYRLMGLMLLFLAGRAARADEVLQSPERTVTRALPDDSSFERDTEFQKKYRELLRREEAARASLQGAAPQTPTHSPDPALGHLGGYPDVEPDVREGPRAVLEAAAKEAAAVVRGPRRKGPSKGPATGVLTFKVSTAATASEHTHVLPAGSFVKARVVSGVEANTLEPYPVLLQLEYAFTGPNKTKIDLSSCFMIAKARANLSTERVLMETDTLSCVRKNGEHFKTSARGYTAGEDSTFGATGTLISKQSSVLLAAVLANIAKNAGEAVALAQQTTSLASGGLGASQTSTNVTGDQARFIAGRSVVDGASMIAQWYLDYARQLVPSIAVGSGADVHVVMLETIRVPKLEG